MEKSSYVLLFQEATLANLVYNIDRLIFHERRAAMR